jgi:hypothetical protein
MKRLSYKFFLLIIYLNLNLYALQLKPLKGIVIDDNKNPVKNLSLRFSTVGEVVTTQTGEFIIEIPDNISYLELSISDTSWSMLYPFDYKIPIPSDPGFVNKIVLKKGSQKGSEKLAKVAKDYNKLKNLLTDIGVQQNELKNLFENYVKSESDKTNLNSENLRTAIQKSIKREEIFPQISSLLANYNLKIQNINSYFQNVSDLAFMDTTAFKELIKAVADYNEVFGKLNNDKSSLENDINLYWNDQLKESFSGLTDYIFDEIHTPYVLKFNPITSEMNKLVRGFVPDDDERMEKRVELKKEIQQITNDLNIRLPILERRTKELITKLQTEGFE